MASKNLSTNFNVSPYFDDYDPSKNFQRILFRPGYPIQARELTQLQTIINTQIGRFGESIYRDGAVITGLDFSLTDNTYLKLDSGTTWETLKTLISNVSFGENYQINDEVLLTNSEGDSVIVTIGALGTFTFTLINEVIPSGFFGRILTQNYNVSSGAAGAQFEVSVKISTTSDPTDDREERPMFLVQGFTTLNSTDPPTLYGKYLTGTEFTEGDEIGIWDDDEQDTTSVISTLPANFSGSMQLASVQQGVMFTNSFFVLANQQTIPVRKYEAAPSARIGLAVQEEIVTPQEDPTLLDNAAGSPNENAPGAHRFSLSLNLEAKEIIDEFSEQDTNASASFYELSRVVNGEIVDRQEKPKYSVLGKEMSQRLYDVNGNFILEPFKITFEDKTLFTLTVDPANPHVQGSETLNVIASRDTLEGSDLIGRMFVDNEIPYRITNAVAGTEPDEFQLTLTDVASFVKFEDNQQIPIIDSENYQASFTPGIAYVNGSKFKTLGTTKKDVEKTRTASHVVSETNKFISASYGNYLVLNQPTASLSVADFNVGSLFDLFGDDDASDGSIGTARVKQLKSTINSKMELYLFDARFDSVTLSGVSGTTGDSFITISGTTFEDRHAGSTFTYDSTRYKIVTVSGSTADLNTELVDTFSDVSIDLNYNMSAVKSVQTADTSSTLSVASSVINDLNGDGYDETRLLDSDKTRLIFNASDNVAQDITEVQYSYLEESVVTVGSSIVSLSLDTNETLSAGSSKEEFFIQVVVGNGSKSPGDIIPTTEISTISIGGDITLTNSDWDGADVLVSYPVIRSSAAPLQTNFIFGNTETASSNIIGGSISIDDANGHVRLPASIITKPNLFRSIGLTGVFRLRSVIEISGTSTTINPDEPAFDHTDVTSNYKLDNGQRDEIVDHAYVALRPGRSLPSNDLLIIVDRITTTSSSDRTYYSVDSYDELYYDYLPIVYTSEGESYDLRSSIDFRPRAAELNSTVDFTTWDQSQKTFTQQVFPPYAENASLVQFDVDYYVGRLDKVSITPDFDFKIVQGIPANDPTPPGDIERSLTLYDIYQFPYSSGPNDIETTPYNHDRYTMKDISSLKERIVNLEKTVQLDKVEKAILSAEITDETNTSLLKTGILVDAFSNTEVADVSNPNFLASIDIQEGQMRPAFDQYSLSLEFDANDTETTAIQTPDGIILAQYDDNAPATFLEQTLATRTENLNAFSIIDWLGDIKLTPEKDFWKDIIRKPDVVTNVGGNNEAWKFIENNIPDRTEWNSWKTRWSGILRRPRWRLWHSRRRRFRDFRATSFQERSGIRKTFDTQIEKKSLGDRVVDQSVIPYMRSVPGGIRFFGQSMKPNTLLYAFFDNTSVMEYIRPGVVYALSRTDYSPLFENAVLGSSSHTINAETVTLTGKTSDNTYVYFHFAPSDRDSSIYGSVSTADTLEIDGTDVTGNIEKTIDQNVSGSFRLKSDPVGGVSGIFDVPTGTFKTGTRTFKLTDSSTNIDGSSDTNAEKDFDASGIKSIVQEQIVATRVPVVKKKTVKQTRSILGWASTIFSNSPTIKRWKDPIAQSFRVDEAEYPSGLYLHSVDLWFTSKDTSLPVTVQILPFENGYPDTQTVIPFSEVTLNASDVIQTSLPGSSNYTRFKFTTPVFLQPGEYAVALVTNSLKYEVYSALMGEKVLSSTTGTPTERVMNEQPFAGTLFKSQNASTWLPSIEEDLMLRLNRVSFQTGSYTARFDTVFDLTQLEALAPYKVNADEDEFLYTTSGDARFSYNFYQINVPEIADFEEVTPPSYKIKAAELLSNGTVSPNSTFTDSIVNETEELPTTNAVREDSNGTDFRVETTFATSSDVVSPTIDAQQMNVIFIQNLIDQMELNPDNDITIITTGSGYSVGDLFNLNDSVTGDTLGVLEVDSIDPTNSGITSFGFTNDSSQYPTNIIRNTTLVAQNTVTGTGLEVDVKSELDPEDSISESRYISKVVKMKAGFESRDLKVQLSAYRPDGTAIYVYYKVKAAEDADVMENKNWTLMYELTNPNEFSVDKGDFLPLEFVTYNQLSDGTIQSSTRGGVSYTEGGTVYDTFNSYRIKIVLSSTNTRVTPIVENLGATALIDPIAP